MRVCGKDMSNLVTPPTLEKTVNLALHRDLASGRWFIDQLEVRTNGMRSMTQFSGKKAIEDAFSPEFLDLLRPYFPTLLSQQVRSVSGEVMRLSAVVLADLRVLSQAATNGIQRVIVRFCRVAGLIYDILTSDHRPDQGMLETDEADEMKHPTLPPARSDEGLNIQDRFERIAPSEVRAYEGPDSGSLISDRS